MSKDIEKRLPRAVCRWTDALVLGQEKFPAPELAANDAHQLLRPLTGRACKVGLLAVAVAGRAGFPEIFSALLFPLAALGAEGEPSFPRGDRAGRWPFTGGSGSSSSNFAMPI